MPVNVLVVGVFDLFHVGHVELLRRSKEMGNRLIVAINGDEMVSSYKRMPIYKEEERLKIVAACRFVDEAFVIRQYDNKEVIKKYNIHKIVHGNDWERESYLKQIRVTEDFLKENNCELVIIPYTEGISSSEIINRIKQS